MDRRNNQQLDNCQYVSSGDIITDQIFFET